MRNLGYNSPIIHSSFVGCGGIILAIGKKTYFSAAVAPIQP